MKLLVTGGAGFIGSNFIRYWLKNYPQDQVVNLDKLTYAGNPESLKDVEQNPNYRFVKGDVCDVGLVDKLIEDGVDVVVHFAAESHVDRSILKPAEFVRTNVLGTQVLLDAAVRYRIKRFHHISTDEVFGALDLNSPETFTEKTPYDPHSPYSASKAAADHLVRAYHTTYGIPVTITNCSNNYGPYQFPEKLIPLAITNLLEGKKVPIYGDGKYVRDWLFVSDHCRAIDLVIREGRVGETYLVGAQRDGQINNLRLVKIILQIMGKDKDSIKFVNDRPGHDRRYAVDWSKIRLQLGWEPEVGLREGLEKTVTWYRENAGWWKRVKSGDYKTIAR